MSPSLSISPPLSLPLQAGLNPTQLLDKAEAFIKKQPRVSGQYEQILGRSLEGVVTRAEELKRKWNDEYVSVEELVMALAEDMRFVAVSHPMSYLERKG